MTVQIQRNVSTGNGSAASILYILEESPRGRRIFGAIAIAQDAIGNFTCVIDGLGSFVHNIKRAEGSGAEGDDTGRRVIGDIGSIDGSAIMCNRHTLQALANKQFDLHGRGVAFRKTRDTDIISFHSLIGGDRHLGRGRRGDSQLDVLSGAINGCGRDSDFNGLVVERLLELRGENKINWKLPACNAED